MTEIAIAYGRKSFDDPENRTSSVADQEMFARAYAQSHGFNLVQFLATMVSPAPLWSVPGYNRRWRFSKQAKQAS